MIINSFKKSCHTCKDCQDRHIGCHSTCKRYQEWSRQVQEEAQERRRNHAAEQCQIENALRIRENNQRRRREGRLHYR